jgi:hypothetical protein
VYVRTVDENTLTFGHSGCLVDHSFIFFDRQTDSHWVQATGECIEGRLLGKRLSALPVTHTTWRQWRTMHPETLVLEKPPLERYRQAPWYMEESARGAKRLGLAVFVGGAQKLYPLNALAATPLVRDTIAGRHVLVVYHAPSQTAVAFEPIIGDQEIELELSEVSADDVWLRDTAGGVQWSGLTGRPQSRDSSNGVFKQLRTTQFDVDNWPKHFPGSPIFQR